MYFRILAGFLAGVIFFGGVLGVAEATSSGDYDPYPATPEEIAAGAQTSSNSNDRVAKTSDEVVREEKARIAAEAAEQEKIDKEAEDFQKRIDGVKEQINAIKPIDLSGKKISKKDGETYTSEPENVPIEVEIDRAKQVVEALGDKDKKPKNEQEAENIQKCLKGILLQESEINWGELKKGECQNIEFIDNNGITKISHYLNDNIVTPILPRIEEFEKQAREWQNLLEDLQVLEADLDSSEVLGEGVTEETAQTTRTSLTEQIKDIKESILVKFANAGLKGETDDEKIEELKEKINDYLEKVAIQRMRANSLRLMLEHDETIRALWNTVDNSRGFSVSGVLSVGNEADWELVSVDPESRTNILAYLIRLALQVIGTFAILMLVVGGYLMMTALNDDNRLQKGKTIVITTIAGLIIAFLSYLIVKVLFAFMF